MPHYSHTRERKRFHSRIARLLQWLVSGIVRSRFPACCCWKLGLLDILSLHIQQLSVSILVKASLIHQCPISFTKSNNSKTFPIPDFILTLEREMALSGLFFSVNYYGQLIRQILQNKLIFRIPKYNIRNKQFRKLNVSIKEGSDWSFLTCDIHLSEAEYGKMNMKKYVGKVLFLSWMESDMNVSLQSVVRKGQV